MKLALVRKSKLNIHGEDRGVCLLSSMPNGRVFKKQHHSEHTCSVSNAPVLFSWPKVYQAIRHLTLSRFLTQSSVFQDGEILHGINSSSHKMPFFSSTLNGELDASNQLSIGFILTLSINSD